MRSRIIKAIRGQENIEVDVSREDRRLIQRIARRAFAMGLQHKGERFDALQIEISLTVCHRNGCKLKLKQLRHADDQLLAHDVFGIHVNLDRATGKLQNFWPKLARGSQ